MKNTFLKFIFAFTVIKIVWSITPIEENFLTQQLLEVFDDALEEISNDIIATSNKKREAILTKENSTATASLFAPIVFTNSHHYWTRKRGRDKTNQEYEDEDGNQQPNTNKFNPNGLQLSNRSKRKVMEAMITIRNRRQIKSDLDGKIEDNNNQTDVESPKLLVKDRNEPKDRNNAKHFKMQYNKCCNDDSDYSGFSEPIILAKKECMSSMKKAQKKFNASDDDVDVQYGLYNMFSCERMNKWKHFVTCVIDCVGIKLGMINSEGALNVTIAKEVIMEHYAIQDWERSASNELVENCEKEIAQTTSKDLNSNGLQCSPKMAEFVYCMWRQFFLTCPTSKQQSTKQCEKLRHVLQQHDDNKFSI